MTKIAAACLIAAAARLASVSLPPLRISKAIHRRQGLDFAAARDRSTPLAPVGWQRRIENPDVQLCRGSSGREYARRDGEK